MVLFLRTHSVLGTYNVLLLLLLHGTTGQSVLNSSNVTLQCISTTDGITPNLKSRDETNEGWTPQIDFITFNTRRGGQHRNMISQPELFEEGLVVYVHRFSYLSCNRIQVLSSVVLSSVGRFRVRCDVQLGWDEAMILDTTTITTRQECFRDRISDRINSI